MFNQMSREQLDALAGLFGFQEASLGMCRILRTIAPLPGTPTLRDMLDAYMDAVRENAGA